MIVADRCIPFGVVFYTGGIVSCPCNVTFPRMNDVFLVEMLCVFRRAVFLTDPYLLRSKS